MNYFAVDLGATSGRTMIAQVINGTPEFEELTRFENPIIEMSGHYYWDIYALYGEILKGLKIVSNRGIDIESIGIDTWGVDFVCVGEDGALLRNPRSYRDTYTNGMITKFFEEKMPADKVYAKTGIQFANYNSLFQLYAMRKNNDSALKAAKKILFLPDALGYLLTGQMVCEYTIASTSQLLNPVTKDLDEELLATLDLKREQFGKMVFPGSVLGTLTSEVQRLTGLGAVKVVSVAGHDTASAVAAIKADTEKFAFLSSGTWSLMGIVTKEPIISERSFNLNFTNEGGLNGTTRFLKNITGMWILEQCRREWKKMGKDYGYGEIMQMFSSTDVASVFNPDDEMFANPTSMLGAIAEYCRQHGIEEPKTDAEIIRSIFISLVERYKVVFGWLQELAPFKIEKLYVIGGGSKNKLLNQLIEEALGVPVCVGDTESTAVGNIICQM